MIAPTMANITILDRKYDHDVLPLFENLQTRLQSEFVFSVRREKMKGKNEKAIFSYSAGNTKKDDVLEIYFFSSAQKRYNQRPSELHIAIMNDTLIKYCHETQKDCYSEELKIEAIVEEILTYGLAPMKNVPHSKKEVQ